MVSKLTALRGCFLGGAVDIPPAPGRPNSIMTSIGCGLAYPLPPLPLSPPAPFPSPLLPPSHSVFFSPSPSCFLPVPFTSSPLPCPLPLSRHLVHRRAAADNQSGDGTDRLAQGGDQVSQERALPGRTGVCEPSHVPPGWVWLKVHCTFRQRLGLDCVFAVWGR